MKTLLDMIMEEEDFGIDLNEEQLNCKTQRRILMYDIDRTLVKAVSPTLLDEIIQGEISGSKKATVPCQ